MKRRFLVVTTLVGVALDDLCRGAEYDDRPVVHRVLEYRAREDDAVEQRHRQAGGDPATELAQRAAGGRAVDEDMVVDPCLQCGDHERLAVVDEAEMRHERRIQDGVDRRAVVLGALRQPAHAGPVRRGGM